MDAISPTSSRDTSLDALRGLIMMIMALDHVRDFFHRQAMMFRPEDLAHTTPAIFLTRWITHFCAPVFMATAGVSALLWLRDGRTKAQLSTFLWQRGLWLVFLEVTVLRFAMFFSLTFGPVLLTVLWALGCSMIALSLLIHLPTRVLAILSVATIVLHNTTDSLKASQFGSADRLWKILHEGGVIPIANMVFVVGYPLIPWFAVMAAGYCFGQVMTLSIERRRRIMWRLGSAMTCGFLIVRAVNKYGDPRPWIMAAPVTTVLSFLRCNKYPPSLDFLLMTLGPALLVLAILQNRHLSERNPLLVFGRTPLFFFLVHFFVAHLLAIPLAAFRYGHVGFLWQPSSTFGGSMKNYPSDYGYPLTGVYALWIGVLVMLYPACLWFGRVKRERHFWWLKFL